MSDWLVSANLLSVLLHKNNIQHFTLDEVLKGWNVPPQLINNIELSLVKVDTMREELGFPIVLTSVYRPDWYNKLVGGVKGSLHTYFNAIDSMPESGSVKQLKMMHDWIYENRDSGMGIGYYQTFLHIDYRCILGRKSATWGKKL